MNKGYYVYVSEWQPIIRYGIKHDWKAFSRYPCRLTDESAWGNLLAFKVKPDEELLLRSLRKLAGINGSNENVLHEELDSSRASYYHNIKQSISDTLAPFPLLHRSVKKVWGVIRDIRRSI